MGKKRVTNLTFWLKIQDQRLQKPFSTSLKILICKKMVNFIWSVSPISERKGEYIKEFKNKLNFGLLYQFDLLKNYFISIWFIVRFKTPTLWKPKLKSYALKCKPCRQNFNVKTEGTGSFTIICVSTRNYSIE